MASAHGWRLANYKVVPDGTDGPKPEANTFSCYPAHIKNRIGHLIDRVREDWNVVFQIFKFNSFQSACHQKKLLFY